VISRRDSMEAIKKDNNKFYIGENIENPLAEITFVPKGAEEIIIDHTYVSDSLRGQKVGLQLVNKVAEYARRENKKIIPLCPYAKRVMTQSDEYKDVLIESRFS
jgi:uncharacterized protein